MTIISSIVKKININGNISGTGRFGDKAWRKRKPKKHSDTIVLVVMNHWTMIQKEISFRTYGIGCNSSKECKMYPKYLHNHRKNRWARNPDVPVVREDQLSAQIMCMEVGTQHAK
jgi:hypothetical protein